jgi:hypothetical protein
MCGKPKRLEERMNSLTLVIAAYVIISVLTGFLNLLRLSNKEAHRRHDEKARELETTS